MISATTLRLLMELGVTGEALLRVVESLEKDAVTQRYANVTPVTPNAARQARFRARQRVTKALLSPCARVEDSSSILETTGFDDEEAKGVTPVTLVTPEKYAIQHGKFRLNHRDLEQWERAFPHVAVEGQCIASAPWASKQPNPFFAMSGRLAKLEREATKTNGATEPRPRFDSYGQRIG